MKAFETNANESRKRIRKVHRRARWAGFFYLLGSLALAVLAFLPNIEIEFAGQKALSVMTFYAGITNVFDGGFTGAICVDLMIAVLYIIVLLFVVINFLRSIAKFRQVWKNNSRNINMCNKNMAAMEKMGSVYSWSLSTTAVCYFLIYTLGQKPTLVMPWFYITLAVGLLIHFLGGVIGGSISLFIIGSAVEEKKRDNGVFVFFVRNLLQTIVLAVIVYCFSAVCMLYRQIPAVINDPASATGDVMELVKIAIQVLAVIWIIVLIKHTTNTTEYNLWGIDGKGFNNFAIFSFLLALTGVAAYIFIQLKVETDLGEEIYVYIFNHLIVACAAFLGFLLDVIIRPRRKNKPIEFSPLEKPDTMEYAQPQPCAPVMPMMPMCPYACGMQKPVCPSACLSDNEAERRRLNREGQCTKECGDSLKYARAQARANQRRKKYNNKRAAKVATAEAKFVDSLDKASPEGAVADNGEWDVKISLPKALMPQPMQEPATQQGLPTLWEVKCPNCSKLLTTKEGAPYYRCPACGKVFGLRKGKKGSAQ